MVLDIVLLCIITLLAWQGAARGFVQSLLGPVAFLLATGIALAYFGITKNVFITILIGLFGPFLLHWFLALAVRSFGKVAGGDGKESLVSSLLGAVVTICWGLLFIVPIMVCLALLPPNLPGFAPVHKYLLSTNSFIVTQQVLRQLNVVAPQAAAKAEGDDPTPAPQPAIQSIAEDERLKELMKDPAIAKAVESNNVAGLISNPKFMQLVQQLAQDPNFLKKAMSAYSQMGPATKQQAQKN